MIARRRSKGINELQEQYIQQYGYDDYQFRNVVLLFLERLEL